MDEPQKQQKLCPSKICMYTLLERDIVQGKVLASLTNSTQFTDKFRYSDNQRPTKTLHAICFIGNNLSKLASIQVVMINSHGAHTKIPENQVHTSPVLEITVGH